MRQFLLYGHVLSTEEAELYADYELKKNPPTLDNFKEQVLFHQPFTDVINCNLSFCSFPLWLLSLSRHTIHHFRLTCLSHCSCE